MAPLEKKLILFPGNKKNPVKNYAFLERTLKFLNRTQFEVVELTNILRNNVPVYMNAVDVVVLTSIKEGSPQVIKEAAFCGVPIVAVNVGDVAFVLEGSNNSHIVERNEKLFAEKIFEAMDRAENTGFKNLSEYDNKVVSSKIYNLYKYLIGNEE